ncbi:protein translocase subunit SecF [Luteimonas sp. M1R5S18]|uniref:Protein-export membrane protein SecF n=1 Tax=Luteimonas rhizosphaericola TaxID=3042024 RepID=A0ABT6JMW3_9GAMM|nr:protein translocase subunit SecF [Luteimonas rhizosphaericola]MDH5832016.1 protein translocase subunit SecF [Luteimonas rhizosphaericola]
MALFPLKLIPAETRIDFMRWRVVTVVFMLAMMIASIALIATRGFNYALDFTGGTSVELLFERPVDVDQLRQRLESAGYPGAQVQTMGTATDLMIRLQPKDGGSDAEAINRTADDVLAAASSDGNAATIKGRSFVGPQVGQDLARKGIYAIVFVVLGFLIYIAFRFEWKFAVSAIITTLGDVVIVAGWFSLSGREFDLTLLAGLLTVMGFSINDTIVVFDRVRENFRTMRAGPLEVLNTSINQTLSRTIITSFVAFLTVLALYIYGGGSLEGMSEAMMIGIAIGTASSILVACPLLTMGPLRVTKQDLLPKARDEEALARRP